MSDPSPANPVGDRATRVDHGPAGGDLSRLQDDQRLRWSRGEQVFVEDYLTAFASALRDPDALLEILYHEVLVREEFGDAPELDEYLRRFPQLARQIRDHFEIHAALKSNRWLTKSGAPGLADAATHTDPGGRAAGAGPSIPGYEVIRELGRGGMGVVYLAWQTGLGRLVALKMIRACEYSRPQDLARFRSEAEAVARLEHPNIVKIYEIGEKDGCPNFSMEYVDSGRLADSLRGAPWPPRRAAELAETLARAAHSAHARGAVHRDLTPNNVLLKADDQPKIVDFGLAKLLVGGAGHTASGAILGTPSYIAPEQACGRSKEVGPAADVYALGAILYELLTGRPPFKAETPLDSLFQVVNDKPVTPRRLRPKVPRDLETVCLKCLNKEPTRRYPGASALADDLRRYLAGEPVRARPVGAVRRAVRWVRRRPAVATHLAVCATGAAVAFAVMTREGRQARLAQSRTEQAQKAGETRRVAAEAARAYDAKQRRLNQEFMTVHWGSNSDDKDGESANLGAQATASCPNCQRLQAQLDGPRAQLEILHATIARLQEQLAAARKDSSTSSKPRPPASSSCPSQHRPKAMTDAERADNPNTPSTNAPRFRPKPSTTGPSIIAATPAPRAGRTCIPPSRSRRGWFGRSISASCPCQSRGIAGIRDAGCGGPARSRSRSSRSNSCGDRDGASGE
ncbi:MAG: serine/threonine protein kinase [Planctomycetaceae bacterium]|nr:serine/threonine protein kinase [Planctomycetaceae bacterium]